MDAMVSARVPAEIKKRGDKMLKDMGSSATELVNSAYAYLLECGTLPKPTSRTVSETPQTKTLSGADAQAFKDAWEKRAVLPAHSYDGSNFKDLLDEARGDYFARFA